MAYNDLTNMLMANPWMFDPSQLSNQFSNYNNMRMPGPTYANPPVNAATGQPIQSFQQQNPGGVTLNQTPAQPQQAQSPSGFLPASPNAQIPGGVPGGMLTPGMPGSYNPGAWGNQSLASLPQAQPQQQAQPQPQASGQPSNWQNYLNALANPGKVTTPGATVPQATGSQPAGGVNQAWLNQIGSGQGMNQNFLSALRAIQGR